MVQDQNEDILSTFQQREEVNHKQVEAVKDFLDYSSLDDNDPAQNKALRDEAEQADISQDEMESSLEVNAGEKAPLVFKPNLAKNDQLSQLRDENKELKRLNKMMKKEIEKLKKRKKPNRSKGSKEKSNKSSSEKITECCNDKWATYSSAAIGPAASIIKQVGK